MMKVRSSMRMISRLPRFSIRQITLILTLIVGVTSVHTYAAEPTSQAEPAEANEIETAARAIHRTGFVEVPEDSGRDAASRAGLESAIRCVTFHSLNT